MKKILGFLFLALVGFPPEMSLAKHDFGPVTDGKPCASLEDFGGKTDSHLVLYFDTGGNPPSEEIGLKAGCEDVYVNQIRPYIEDRSQKDPELAFVTIGVADLQGHDRGYDNNTLSCAREKYMTNLLGLKSQAMYRFCGGDASAEGFSPSWNKVANPNQRAAHLFFLVGGDSGFTCSDAKMKMIASADAALARYSSNQNVDSLRAELDAVRPLCKELGQYLDQNDDNKIATVVRHILDALGASSEYYIDIDVAQWTTQINSSVASLSSLLESLSVWKNSEGKFNTARLISDSVAGVVLGTVGGVVTSTVMKKNQVKHGFEDLRCVTGGQDLAAYGDEFMVQFQK